MLPLRYYGVLAALLSIAPPALGASYSTTFYFSPHQDDWQLFMGQNSINDVLNTTNQTVFVYLTAGDGGCGTGCPAGVNATPYYLVRDEGAMRAMEFVEGQVNPATATTSWVTINGHEIEQWSYGSVTAFFLHLPNDYAPDGGLFDTPFYQFATGQLSSMSAIDGSTTYSSWSDLTTTLADIVQTEVQDNGSEVAWVNSPEPSQTLNPGDHGDHYATGMAAQAAVAQLPCVGIAYFQDYNNANYPIDMDANSLMYQTGTFAVETSTLDENSVGSTFGDHGSSWLGRQYMTEYTVGTQSCAAASMTPIADSVLPGAMSFAATSGSITDGSLEPLSTLVTEPAIATEVSASAPEPSTLALLGVGMMGLGIVLRTRRA